MDQRRFPSQSISRRFVVVEPMPRKKEPTLRFPTMAPQETLGKRNCRSGRKRRTRRRR
jgi:hypothetical protein